MSIVPIRTEHPDIQPDDVLSMFLAFTRATGISQATGREYKIILSSFFSRYSDAMDFPRERTMEFLSTYENPLTYNIRFACLKVFRDWTLQEGYFGGDRHPLSGLKKRWTHSLVCRPEAVQPPKDLGLIFLLFKDTTKPRSSPYGYGDQLASPAGSAVICCHFVQMRMTAASDARPSGGVNSTRHAPPWRGMARLPARQMRSA